MTDPIIDRECIIAIVRLLSAIVHIDDVDFSCMSSPLLSPTLATGRKS